MYQQAWRLHWLCEYWNTLNHGMPLLHRDGSYITKDSEILLDIVERDPNLTVIIDGSRPDHLNCRMVLVTSPALVITRVCHSHKSSSKSSWNALEIPVGCIKNPFGLTRRILNFASEPKFCFWCVVHSHAKKALRQVHSCNFLWEHSIVIRPQCTHSLVYACKKYVCM